MSVWEELAGQDPVVQVLGNAAFAAQNNIFDGAMTHAWLITGPAGSGRSVAARAFAAALQCTGRPLLAGGPGGNSLAAGESLGKITTGDMAGADTGPTTAATSSFATADTATRPITSTANTASTATPPTVSTTTTTVLPTAVSPASPVDPAAPAAPTDLTATATATASRKAAANPEITASVPLLPGCGECKSCQDVMASRHPDVCTLATDKMTISIDEVRSLILTAQQAPSVGKWRVIIVEDTDRMLERTTNVLLKSVEEPPPRTVWILCAPSAADVIPTIRSRCRLVTLRVPSPEAVAELLVKRDGVDTNTALECAIEAQSHVGFARALATDPSLRARRNQVIETLVEVRSFSDAELVAAQIVADFTSLAKEKLEAPDKARERRLLVDQIDRLLQDTMSLIRDALVCAYGSPVGLINSKIVSSSRIIAQRFSPTELIEKMSLTRQARSRLATNAASQLVLEAWLATVFAPCTSKAAIRKFEI